MADEIRFDYDEYDQIIKQIHSALDEAEESDNAEPHPNVDPEANQVTEEDREEFKEIAREAHDNADVAGEANETVREVGEAAAQGLDQTGTDFHTTHGASGSGGGTSSGSASPSATTVTAPSAPTAAGGGSAETVTPGGGGAPGGTGTSPTPTATMPSTTANSPTSTTIGGDYAPGGNPNAGMHLAEGGSFADQQPTLLPTAPPPPGTAITTPMPQPDPGLYENYTPTPATATQQDLYYAPNRQELQDAIYDALKEAEENGGAPGGLAGTGDAGDNRPRITGSPGGSVGPLADDETARRVQQICQNVVDSDVPYAWGGGHGEAPGPSQGTSDGGGYADRCGDYNKIGMDCSGFARYVVSETWGVDAANGSAATQYSSGMPVAAEEARPGDLVFPASAGRPPGHVQVYVGNGQVCEAQQSGTNIMFSPLESGAEFRRMVDY